MAKVSGVPLKEWAEANVTEWGRAHRTDSTYWSQIDFARETLGRILCPTFAEFELFPEDVLVISSHTCQSVVLPVYKFEVGGVTFVMRRNDSNWMVSVFSLFDIRADFLDLFDPEERISTVYCEGFPPGLVYGSYAESKRQFTVELSGGDCVIDHKLFTFFWIITHQVFGWGDEERKKKRIRQVRDALNKCNDPARLEQIATILGV